VLARPYSCKTTANQKEINVGHPVSRILSTNKNKPLESQLIAEHTNQETPRFTPYNIRLGRFYGWLQPH
jgi:hypothetical protein